MSSGAADRMSDEDKSKDQVNSETPRCRQELLTERQIKTSQRTI